MNARTLRLFENLPLPLTSARHNAWVIDTTGVEITAKTWATDQCPYSYTPLGMWARMAMAGNKRRVESILRRLADYARRTDGELHDLAKFPRDISSEDIARCALVKAVFEPDSPFVLVSVRADGYAEFSSGRYPDLVLTTPNVNVKPSGWDR